MKKFTITTLGCKVNQYESDALAAHFRADGWTPAQAGENADLCIVNTCTVTRKASMQSRQAIRHAVKTNPRARIVATGCYAQTEPAALAEIAGVEYVVGHSDKHRIPDILAEKNGDGTADPIVIRHDLSRERRFARFDCPAKGRRTRAFLKVQDGCDTFCTYCIVPYSRGRSRSMPPADVLDHIIRLKAAGFREAVLTGIHLGCYGLDLEPRTGLAELLDRIQSAGPIDRVRLSSIEPHEITDEIIDLTAASKQFCHHFHIPLQSGADAILEKMHRPYTADFFRRLVLKIHAAVPNAAIGVDTLIGFPGETERLFEQTCDLIKTLPVTYLHVFPFSPRKGTPAAGYPEQVPTALVKERCRRMRELGMLKKNAFYERHIGQVTDVLIEGTRDKTTGRLKGTTGNYLSVQLEGSDHLKETIVKVRIESLHHRGNAPVLYGRRVPAAAER